MVSLPSFVVWPSSVAKFAKSIKKHSKTKNSETTAHVNKHAVTPPDFGQKKAMPTPCPGPHPPLRHQKGGGRQVGHRVGRAGRAAGAAGAQAAASAGAEAHAEADAQGHSGADANADPDAWHGTSGEGNFVSFLSFNRYP